MTALKEFLSRGSVFPRLLLVVLVGAGLSGCAFFQKQDAGTSGDPPSGIQASDSGYPAQAESGSPIWFRVMLTDENGDQTVESGELVTVAVEVMNAGPGPAQNVQVVLTGSPVLLQQLVNPLMVGDLGAGERKRVAVSGRVPAVEVAQQAELLVSVEVGSPGAGPTGAKKFVLAMRPRGAGPVAPKAGGTPTGSILTDQGTVGQAAGSPPGGGQGIVAGQGEPAEAVEIDQIPRPVPGYKRHDAIGLAIGIGAFRNPEVPEVPYAGRDADMIAKYLTTVGGVSPAKVKVLVDDFALKDDITEALDEWLPHHARKDGTVLVFFSGRAIVDPATGAVSLVPHEGRPRSPSRLISLRRLQTALARLPVRRALLILDLSLTSLPKTGKDRVKDPVWNPVGPALDKGKLVQILGVSGVQEAHRYEPGRHGLFTYFVLKGLRGSADRDGDGLVTVGELYEYVHGSVTSLAQTRYGNAQEPFSLPAFTRGDKTWAFPVARVK